jgi:4-alpha-glucanotransferase
LDAGPGLWGFAIQLYGLRSERNWGVGDFTDLARFVRDAGTLGAGVIGLNPLHALFAADPGRYGPYAPSARLFVNVMYIDVEVVPDLAECPEARALADDAETSGTLRDLRGRSLVDYREAGALKLKVLESTYRCFRERHLGGGETTERGRAFRCFQEAGGSDLRNFAVFEALCEHFWSRLGPGTPWWQWPEPFRRCGSAEVRQFTADNLTRVEFFEYLQWLAEEQLAAADAACRDAGLPVGLYCDIALGVDAAGAEAWCYRDMMAEGVHVGAPPDDFNLRGQDWGLPPFRPDALRESAYRPFIALLRATMRHAGAIRIDHVLGLRRLFWVPAGRRPEEGGYVRYPFEEMLAVVALESHRNRCVVVGEDLGTVPSGLRERFAATGVLSYRLFYFERGAHGAIPAPADYPRLALVAPSTHDLPTLPGYWHERDLEVRAELGQFPSGADETRARRERKRDLAAMLRSLEAFGYLPKGFPAGRGGAGGEEARERAFVDAVYRYLADTPGRILMVQLEDVLGLREQANLPGTHGEHANWRRKLPAPIADVLGVERLRTLAAMLNGKRPARGGPGGDDG